MIRLLAAMLLVGALGHFVRWLFGRRRQAVLQRQAVQAGQGTSPKSSRSRRFFASAVKSLLIGMGIVFAMFVVKLVAFEVMRLNDNKIESAGE